MTPARDSALAGAATSRRTEAAPRARALRDRPAAPGGNHCPRCGVFVKPENMPDHLRRVHAATEEADRLAREQAAAARRQGGAPRPRQRVRVGAKTWAALGVVALLAFAGYAWAVLGIGRAPEYGPNTPVTEMCMQHGSLHHHYHARLTIIALGSPQQIEANIGVAPGCMRPVHTHDTTGTIHIETPVTHDFTLGDFFTVWGQPFSESQILSYRADAGHTIAMTVNGFPSTAFRALFLQDGQDIVIEYRAG